MARLVRITIAIGIVALQAATLMARPRPRVVSVDCDRRGSINAALESATTPIVIEFRGTCNENVVLAADDVTLRGILGAGAAIVGTGGTALEVIGSDRVKLESFRVTNPEGIGIYLRDGTHAVLEQIDASGNAGSGLIVEGSNARLWNTSFNDNRVDGISAWNQSMVTLLGTIDASRNGRAGILLSTAALTNEYRWFNAATIHDNRWGIALQYGAHANIQTAMVTLELTGNRDEGITLYDASSFVGPAAVSGSTVGVWVRHSVFESFSLRVTGADIGIFGDLGAALTIGRSDVTGNDSGIILEAAKLQMSDGSLTGNPSGDLTINFGSHASLHRITPGVVTCDGSVNILRGVTCGSPARAPRLTTHASVERPSPRQPFARMH